MRNWSWLASSLLAAAAAHAGPPANIEIEYELTRNGSTMAEVVEHLEHGKGAYQLTETWKGKGLYALLGRAKRVSQGSLDGDGPRPHEYTDERSGRDTQRVSIDWKAKTITRRYKGQTRTEAVPADTQDRLSFLLKLSYLTRQGSHEYILNPEPTASELQLSSTGTSRYKEFEATTRYLGGERKDLTLSYVWAKGTADLNPYDQFYGNFRNPIVRPNQYGLTSTDVRHRLLLRAPRRPHRRRRERLFPAGLPPHRPRARRQRHLSPAAHGWPRAGDGDDAPGRKAAGEDGAGVGLDQSLRA